MKKLSRILATVLAVGALSMTTTFALPSITGNGQTVGTVLIDGKEDHSLKVQFEDGIKNVPAAVETQIEKLNAGTELDTVIKANEVKNNTTLKVEDIALLTKFQDLVVRDENGNLVKDAKNITVTWEVPNLSKDLGEVAVLHYSSVRNVYELLKPSKVDYTNKTITCTFPDLSPVAVVYTPAAKGEAQGQQDSNKVPTGDNTNIALYAVAGIAAVALIAGLVVKSKKHN